MPTRKTPHILADEEEEDDHNGVSELQQELLPEFREAGGDELPDQSPFGFLVDDTREKKREQGLSEDVIDGAEQYVAFETNHPLTNKRGDRNRDTIPEEEQRHAASRKVRNYGNRGVSKAATRKSATSCRVQVVKAWYCGSSSSYPCVRCATAGSWLIA
ncbi:hypothetical protein [Haloarcula argentinensis]|uniref:Uncharacterized protein n=1 Tax=Haloarcula argentinensis TaxID=43776 RepID=A0A847UFD8_HALAR|nr:hypothetical protein [Haloarcula argentinensis]NLV11949.1 hypothetical protein [Haloarcula argentinensis]